MDRNELEEGTVVLEPGYLDAAAIGTDVETGRVVYSYDKLVEAFVEHDGMTYEEAVDHVGYNTVRALPYMGENSPIVVQDFAE